MTASSMARGLFAFFRGSRIRRRSPACWRPGRVRQLGERHRARRGGRPPAQPALRRAWRTPPPAAAARPRSDSGRPRAPAPPPSPAAGRAAVRREEREAGRVGAVQDHGPRGQTGRIGAYRGRRTIRQAARRRSRPDTSAGFVPCGPPPRSNSIDDCGGLPERGRRLTGRVEKPSSSRPCPGADSSWAARRFPRRTPARGRAGLCWQVARRTCSEKGCQREQADPRAACATS